MENIIQNSCLKEKLKALSIRMVRKTTFHGIQNIIDSRNLIQKVVWLILTMFALACSSVLIATNVIDFIQYPVIPQIQKVHEESPEFPQVNFCNAKKYACRFDANDCESKFPLQPVPNGCVKFNRGKNIDGYPIEVFRSKRAGHRFGLNFTFWEIEGKDLEIYILNQSAEFDVNKVIMVSPGMETKLVINKVFESR